MRLAPLTWLGPALCVLAVLWVSWPCLDAPRLDADDYRYLHRLELVAAGELGVLEAGIVENRWDHLWFFAEDGIVRFFRPTVLASYAIDAWLWGSGSDLEFGLTLTNVLLHLACTLLVLALLSAWLGRGWPAVAAALLFAALFAHGECIWYVAGRNASLAALGVLGALVLHVRGKAVWWGVPCFAFALLTKEHTIATPLVLMLHDRLVAHRGLRERWRLWAGYAVAAALVFALKALALAGRGTDFVYPYIVSPLRDEFLDHVWLQVRSYAGNLLFAESSRPFATAVDIAERHSVLGVPLFVALLAGVGVLLRRDGRFWVLLALGVSLWAPTSIVYVSERYLYLPSIAFAGILGLVVATRAPQLRTALVVALVAFAAFQGHALRRKIDAICNQLGSIRELASQLEPVRDRIEPGARLLLFNLPGDWICAQFAEQILCVLLDDPTLEATVMTVMPGQQPLPLTPESLFPAMGGFLRVTADGERRLRASGGQHERDPRPLPVHERWSWSFDQASLATGATHETDRLGVEVIAGTEDAAAELVFELEHPVSSYTVLVWRVDPSTWRDGPWQQRRGARVRVLTPR